MKTVLIDNGFERWTELIWLITESASRFGEHSHEILSTAKCVEFVE
jgi:hypothetical protein